MTALQQNAELFRGLSIIAEDEGLMKKAVKYIKQLSAKKQAMDETKYIMSSPEMVKILREGDEMIAKGNFEPIAIDDLWKQFCLNMQRLTEIIGRTRVTHVFLNLSQPCLKIQSCILFSGIGKPEPLKGESGKWSRRIPPLRGSYT